MTNDVLTWPELAMDLYDKLAGRDAEVTYDFENLDIYVPAQPAHPAEDSALARWKLNGSVKIRSRATRSN